MEKAKHSLVTTQYDGEGRFRRNRQGEVTHFVYYEFGKRLGIARNSMRCLGDSTSRIG